MRKNILVFVLFFAVAFKGSASDIIVRIDPRVELTSIVFRLAGAEDYVTDDTPNYISMVDEYFSKYSDHPLIQHVKEIRDTYYLYYDRVAAIPFLYDIKDGAIVPLDNNKTESWVSDHWNTESAKQFFGMLNDFYSDTDFGSFWNSLIEFRESVQQEAEKTINSLMIDMEWFESFFGKVPERVEIYIAMLNGGNNYASVDFSNNDNCSRILIGCISEKDGLPSIGNDVMPIITHEICHTLGNPLVEERIDKFATFDEVYKKINHITKRYGYGDNDPTVIIYESLNSLFCAEYLMFKNYDYVGYDIADCEDMGYVWMSDLLRFMKNFHSHRDIYPTVKEFMPQLVAYYNQLPYCIDAIMVNNEAKEPYIESVYPANGSVVPTDLQEIRITLSRPVINAYGQKVIAGIKPIPWGRHSYSDDHKTLIFRITGSLEPGETYGIEILGEMLVSQETYHRVRNNYRITYTVK